MAELNIDLAQSLFGLGKGLAQGAAFQGKLQVVRGLHDTPIAFAAPFRDLDPNPEPEFRENLSTALVDRPVLATDLQIGDFKFPIPPVIVVSCKKHVVQTPVAGRDFTVKEIISAEDYSVKINAFLKLPDKPAEEGQRFGQLDDTLPLDMLKQLTDVYKEHKAQQVTCRLLNYVFGIRQLVLTDFTPQTDQYYAGAIAVQLSALSDQDFELELEEEQAEIVDNSRFLGV